MTAHPKEVGVVPATRPTTHLPDDRGVVFESTDPARTEAFLAAAFGTTTKISGDHHNFWYQLSRLGSGPLQLNAVDHVATTEFRADPLPDALAVVRMRRGARTNLYLDDHLVPGDLSLHAQPGQPCHTRLTSSRYSAVVLPIHAAAEAARNRPEDEQRHQLRFHSLRPANPAAARRWLHAVDYVTTNLRAFPEAMSGSLLSGAATRLLAATLLTSFPNTWITEQHHQDRTDATPTTLARAIAFIDTNADLDITVVDIARVAHVSVRAVQLAFRRNLNSTPMAYLRRVRLERAHQELRAAKSHDDTNIARVAAQWGFADPSRFTALYRRTYGQLPSHTLRN